MNHLDVFDKTLQKSIGWIKELMEELGVDDPHRAYLALRTGLHALRDQLNSNEVIHLAAELPMLIRGFYYEGWNPQQKKSRLQNREEFLDYFRKYFRDEPEFSLEILARSVFTVLASHISQGEISDIKGCLPSFITELFPDEQASFEGAVFRRPW